ncbi:MAG: hypothetical protein ACI9UN_001333 [Granulosicoccus sp.]|jgi:hypothetical protein
MTIQLKTHFYSDERCFWHGGGNYAQMLPVGGFVQPLVSGGLPEAPETKRRLKNLIEVTGLSYGQTLALRVGESRCGNGHLEANLQAFDKLMGLGGSPRNRVRLLRSRLFP